MTQIFLKRAYVEPEPDDGYRILVDRLWPRGVKKEDLSIDTWAKDVTPSPALRKSWNHDPKTFAHFARSYREELNQNDDVDDFLELVSSHAAVTFVYGAKNEKINHAVILREYVLDQLED